MRRLLPSGLQLMLWALPVFVTVVFVLPFAGVALWSVTRPTPGLENYVRIFGDAGIRTVLWRTLWLCSVSTLVSTGVAYILAYYWVMGRPAVSRAIEICIFVPFWVSVLVRAFGWVVILRHNGLASMVASELGLPSDLLATGRSETSVVIGMVHYMVPFTVLPIAAAMRKIDRRILLAAHGLGAGLPTVFWRVFAPLSLPGLYSGLSVTFILSFGFFVTPMVLGGGQVMMIAEAIYVQMFQIANWGMASALGMVLLAFMAVALGLAQFVLKPAKSKGR